mmetsp:Transcript_36520/g.36935  ORF Transcript_36520/g.36935 Transcript_36520/m.36935 type:complete len:307 (+) Transcript_36520:294-1214(+)
MQLRNSSGENTGKHESTHRDRSKRLMIPQPIAEEGQQQQQQEHLRQDQTEKASQSIPIMGNGSYASSFINSMKNFFAPCVGAVDAASLYIGECRPSKYETYETNQQGGDNNNNVAEDVIMRLRQRNGAFTKQAVKQKRGETLEIPTHGMLLDDDDVSALSAHTLEEMERLRIAQQSNKRISNFHMSPPPKTKANHRTNKSSSNNIIRPKSRHQKQQSAQSQHSTFGSFTNKKLWNIQQHHQSSPVFSSPNNGDLSICVSASDSSSSSEGIIEQGQEKKDRRGPAPPPGWGKMESTKEHRFKTHRVG